MKKRFWIGGCVAAIVALSLAFPHKRHTGASDAPPPQPAYTGPIFGFTEAEAVARMGKSFPDILTAEVKTSTAMDGAVCSARMTDFATVTICSFANKVQRIDYKVMGNGNNKNKELSPIIAHAYMDLLAPPEGYTRRDTKRIEDEIVTDLIEKRDTWLAIDQWFVFVDSQGGWSYTISLSPASQPWTKFQNDTNSAANAGGIKKTN